MKNCIPKWGVPSGTPQKEEVIITNLNLKPAIAAGIGLREVFTSSLSLCSQT